jgi:hypothetical protein
MFFYTKNRAWVHKSKYTISVIALIISLLSLITSLVLFKSSQDSINLISDVQWRHNLKNDQELLMLDPTYIDKMQLNP